VNKSKYLFTFTASSKGRGVYTKLRLINEIKSYVTYLIANSKADIYFFSNIEIGSELSNPHLHTQIWSDDKEAVSEIYDRVIKKFALKAKRCKLSEPTRSAGPSCWTTQKQDSVSGPKDDISHKVHPFGLPKNGDKDVVLKGKPQRPLDFYDYVIKDYSKNLNDDEIWNLEQTKKRMRKTLGLKLRFYSRSKSKYTSKLYRMVYHTYGILRAMADSFIEFMVNTFFVKKGDREDLLKKNISSISSFITIKNKGVLICVVVNIFLGFTVDLEILFYSPANDPPLLRIECSYFYIKE